MNPENANSILIGLHDRPVVIARNHFLYKSLSSWAVNGYLGCLHGCRFCYVPDTTANKQCALLRSYGVSDPVTDWGNYLLVRPWDERAFMKSLRDAESTALSDLNVEGNRAVMFSSTTDPYQVIRGGDPDKRSMLSTIDRSNMRRSLQRILENSTLNVRILTRSPLARQDFDLLKQFRNRLLLGVSLPTLDDDLARLYEPHSPAPKQRLKLLVDAHAEGIPTFVAVAPVFPEVGYDGMLEVFNAVKAVDPFTIFMEPVNMRLGIAERIREEAIKIGKGINMTPYTDNNAWVKYAIRTLRDAERAADAAGVRDRLHLWPDHEALGAAKVIESQSTAWKHPRDLTYKEWLQSYWNRISEWPGKVAG